MAIPKKVINFLEKGKVKYEAIGHRTVYTAFDKAKTLKRGPLAGGWRVGRSPEKMVGKTLILKMDGKLTVVLIPANKNLDLQKFKKLAKALPAACLPDRQGRQALKSNIFLSQPIDLRETVSPPIQSPVIVSSIPSHLENPIPVATATVQIGQTANAFLAKSRPTAMMGKI